MLNKTICSVVQKAVSVSGESSSETWVRLQDPPPIPNLRFRHFRGESDYPHMVAVTEGMKEADQLELTMSVEDVAREFKHLEHCDPYRDFLFVEVDGRVVGYTRVWWSKDPSGLHLYNHFADLLPEWRGKGIRNAMLRYSEQKLREMAQSHPTGVPHLFQTIVIDSEKDWISVLTSEGYSVFRYGFRMIRPNLDNIPDSPLPGGIEVRAAKLEHYRAIVDAWNKACEDMRGQIPISDEDFKWFQESPMFDPSLWQIAWHNDEVVGTVINFIDGRENTEYRRRRGHVELISVKRQWRGRGIAKALIARSFSILKERGMTEAALGVDAENPSGALHLYQKMGFQIQKKTIFYRKPMNQNSP
jgi:ribosomal protein S18 acetylase RimI-like enzyme